jgi:DUF917 family protein
MLLQAESVEFAVLGGAFLGGGGGGLMAEGKRIGEHALSAGKPTMVGLEELPGDAVLVTVSAVGAPAAPEIHLEPDDYVRAVEILRDHGVRVDALMTSENGGLSTLNGWFQSAVLNIPVVDAACNGRAHPMGLMGSMGLHRVPSYRSIQSAVGGSRARGKHLEVLVSGNPADAAGLIRQAAILAGGLVAVARNPVSAAYAGENAAPGAVTQAIEIGRRLMSGESLAAALDAVFAYLGGGHALEPGRVENFLLETRGGFDVGHFHVRSPEAHYELAFCNEYVTLNEGLERVATFPDLIVTMNPATRLPLATGEIRNGMSVLPVYVPKAHLKLGAGMRDPALFEPLQAITGREIIKYL